jgi:ABC transporter DrrB family efflux protein
MAATLTSAPAGGVPVQHRSRLRDWLGDVAALTRRNLWHIRREPAQLSDATIQPVLFTILFVYVFGSAMSVPGGSYKDFAIGGLVAMNLTTSAVGTAVGLSSDLHTGVIDRFRTLPIGRSTILVGRSMSDLMASVLCGSIVIATGFAIGWRPDKGLPGVLAGLAVAAAFAYAMSWLTACIGLVVSDHESEQGIGLIAMFPLSFISTAFVPSDGMPGWMRVIADWNPVSAVAGSCRELFGNPNPAGAHDIFPSQHPVIVSLATTAIVLAVCVPLASALLRRRTTN